MEKGTPIGKLSGINFFVYLYRLDSPRTYQKVEGKNTIGFGYVGENENRDAGMARLDSSICWVRQNLDSLKRQYGRDFPDAVQYEMFEHLDKDISMLVGDGLLDEREGKAWIEGNLLEKGNDASGFSEYLGMVLGNERFLMREEGKTGTILSWDALMHLIGRLNEGDGYY